VVAVDTAAVVDPAVAEVTVVAAEAAAVDEAAVAAVAVATVVVEATTAVDEAAVAAVAVATVVVEATTAVDDPDSVTATAAVAMIQGRTTVAPGVPQRDTEAKHEAKLTNLPRLQRKALATAKPIETTGRRKVASAVAAKGTTDLKFHSSSALVAGGEKIP
jgi:hypothetical protein